MPVGDGKWASCGLPFDAIGQWRDDIRRLRARPPEKPAGPEKDEEEKEVAPLEFDLSPVDARETLPDGTEIRGVDDLRAYLLGPRREDFARTIVVKLLAYSLGRSLEFTDQPEVDRLTAGFIESDLKLRTLVQEVVKSDLFRTK